MNILHRRTSRSALVAAALLCASGQTGMLAGPVDELGRPLTASQTTLGSQLAAMSGTGLTGAECRQRIQVMNSLLEKAGYRSVRTGTLEDGTLIARWYHTGRHTTALAFAGQKSSGNAFSAGEYAGLLRWNEFMGTP